MDPPKNFFNTSDDEEWFNITEKDTIPMEELVTKVQQSFPQKQTGGGPPTKPELEMHNHKEALLLTVVSDGQPATSPVSQMVVDATVTSANYVYDEKTFKKN